VPELAEVETIRRGVDAEFVGRRILEVQASGLRTLRRHQDPSEFVSRVDGRTLAATGRRGKYLLLELDGGDTVVAHMGMSGQLLMTPSAVPVAKHTHVVLGFEGGTDLRFVDPRTFGEVFVATAGGSAVMAELAHLGFDPIADGLTPQQLAARLAPRRTKLKPLLMDQRFVAGIGNMYADEILFAARLGHDRTGSSLTPTEVRRLHRAMREVLTAAIEHRGSSLADVQYRDLYGQIGAYQKLHNVYARAGSPCPRCRTPIVRARAGGRSSFFCPKCQGPVAG
jgi:formamidopyrimidine-DNA glycosylase